MGIKSILISEMELRKAADHANNNYRAMSLKVGMSYSGFMKWIKDEGRSLGDSKLDKLADGMGKKIILVDK